MYIPNSRKSLDGRDELILGIIAGFIPLITLGALLY
jgi:hypothetical protein